MRRGEIWTIAGGKDYAGKPGSDMIVPAAILQDDRFDATDSLTICAFTTDPTEAPLIRLRSDPDDLNGLRELSSLMVDKITTAQRTKLGDRVGRLSDDDLMRLGRAIVVFLGLAGA